MSAKDRNIKVKQIAKKLEDKALRKEHKLKVKRPPKPNSAARKRTLSVGGGDSQHPMGKLNVSSVRAPSEMNSLMASPEQNDTKKVLDTHVFGGYSGSRIQSNV